VTSKIGAKPTTKPSSTGVGVKKGGKDDEAGLEDDPIGSSLKEREKAGGVT